MPRASSAGRLALHFEPTRLDAIVEHALTTMDAERGQHRIDYTHPAEAVCIRGDPYRLEQVFANLLENALKYSPADSTVRVTLEVRGEFALLAVADEGIGIPRDQQEQLFERYFRARNVSVTLLRRAGAGALHQPRHRRAPRRPHLGGERGGPGRHLLRGPARCCRPPAPRRRSPRPSTGSPQQVH